MEIPVHAGARAAPGAIVQVMLAPQVVREADGSFSARYPSQDWSVAGATREAAIGALVVESRRRMRDPAYVAAHYEVTLRHVRGEQTTPGIEIAVLSSEQYVERIGRLGARLRRGRQAPGPAGDDGLGGRGR
ncbi:hypothetical protein [Nocardia farcinica]